MVTLTDDQRRLVLRAVQYVTHAQAEEFVSEYDAEGNCLHGRLLELRCGVLTDSDVLTYTVTVDREAYREGDEYGDRYDAVHIVHRDLTFEQAARTLAEWDMCYERGFEEPWPDVHLYVDGRLGDFDADHGNVIMEVQCAAEKLVPVIRAEREAARAEAVRRRDTEEAERRRQADERELARLAAKLGKTIT